MSAYVVENNTIDQIVSYVVEGEKWENREITEKYSPKRNETSFGRELLKINIAAVAARYNDAIYNPDYNYRFTPTSDIQVYKSLRSFLYQCSEGDIDQTELYKIMSRLSDKLAHKLVQESSNYNRASWG